MESIKIVIRTEHDGYSFSLGPQSRTALLGMGAKNIPSKVFVSYETRSDFEQQIGRSILMQQIPIMLIGDSSARLQKNSAE